ncbi:MAG: DUF2892 domain-containing protein [Chlamydiae bacterium]|nr:DUF2892 domain-containing protein [Chlamydiota bacterium]
MRVIRKFFPRNIGLSGRVMRGVMAMLFLWMAYRNQSWVLFLIASFVVFESFMSWCVVYHLIGINRCPVKGRRKKK